METFVVDKLFIKTLFKECPQQHKKWKYESYKAADKEWDTLPLKQNDSWEHNKTGNNWSTGIINRQKEKEEKENFNTKSSQNII